MLRRWCSTSTPDASLNVLYKSCLSFTAQGKTIHDSRGRVQSYSLLQTGDVQWCEAVSVVWPLACSPRLTCWALWFSMSRCLLHMGKVSLPMEGFQRWVSQLQGFGTKKIQVTRENSKQNTRRDQKSEKGIFDSSWTYTIIPEVVGVRRVEVLVGSIVIHHHHLQGCRRRRRTWGSKRRGSRTRGNRS